MARDRPVRVQSGLQSFGRMANFRERGFASSALGSHGPHHVGRAEMTQPLIRILFSGFHSSFRFRITGRKNRNTGDSSPNNRENEAAAAPRVLAVP